MRSRIGIVIDYVLRIPEFKESYTRLKEAILVGSNQGVSNDTINQLNQISANDKADNLDTRNYWALLKDSQPEAVSFYEKTPVPIKNYGKDFDCTFKKYFYNEEHRKKFIEEYSYNLYGQGAIINRTDINLINTAQTKLFDVVLIDRIVHTRKVPNTFAYLARTGLFIKGVEFVKEDTDLVKEARFLGLWDPFTDPGQVIEPTNKPGQATDKFLEFLMNLEEKTRKAKK